MFSLVGSEEVEGRRRRAQPVRENARERKGRRNLRGRLPTQEGPREPSGSHAGCDICTMGAGGSDRSHRPERVLERGRALLSWAADRPHHRADHPRGAIFSGVFHYGGGGGLVLWTNIPRLRVPAAVPAPKIEPPAPGSRALLAAQPDQHPAGFLSPSGSLHLAVVIQGLSSAPGPTGSASRSECGEALAAQQGHGSPRPEPCRVASGGSFLSGKRVHIRGQVARPAVTQRHPSVPPLAPGSSSGFFLRDVGAGRAIRGLLMLSLCLSRPRAAGREPPPQCPPLRLLETPAASTQMHLIKFWGRAEKPTGWPAAVRGHSSL